MENEVSVRESGGSGMKFIDVVEAADDAARKDKDSITQLRNEFKTAIKDLRHDVSKAEIGINSL